VCLTSARVKKSKSHNLILTNTTGNEKVYQCKRVYFNYDVEEYD